MALAAFFVAARCPAAAYTSDTRCRILRFSAAQRTYFAPDTRRQMVVYFRRRHTIPICRASCRRREFRRVY